MSDRTVDSALAEVPVENSCCLEAGAGVGNTSAALLERDASVVYAVTNDSEHATAVHERFDSESRLVPVISDLQATPLSDSSVDVVTAHALLNVLTPSALDQIVTEMTRVTREGGYLVIVDYDPVPNDQIRELFAVENAISELTQTRPALVFHPEKLVKRVFTATGWNCIETGTALDPVPWTGELLDAHVDVIERQLEELPDNLAGPLREHTYEVREYAGEGAKTGSMYYHTFQKTRS